MLYKKGTLSNTKNSYFHTYLQPVFFFLIHLTPNSRSTYEGKMFYFQQSPQVIQKIASCLHDVAKPAFGKISLGNRRVSRTDQLEVFPQLPDTYIPRSHVYLNTRDSFCAVNDESAVTAIKKRPLLTAEDTVI